MKVAAYRGNGAFDIVEAAKPEPDHGWARVAVAAVGICGSDLHRYCDGGGATPGDRPGHEVAGFVDAFGDEVSLPRGTLVAVEPMTYCGACAACRRGAYSQCASMKFLGFGPPGGMAEFFSVPARSLHAAPPEISPKVAALAEPLAVCVRAMRRGRVSAGDRVVILGAGTIGLLCIVAAQAVGAREIFITARHPHQADIARYLGATQTYTDCSALLADVGEAAADVVIETVGGHAHTLLEASDAARRGATIVVLGYFPEATQVKGLLKELTIVGSLGYAYDAERGDFPLAVELMKHLGDKIEALVTHELPLSQINLAFATARDKSTGSVKVQMNPAART
jgi:threonine dehydrogenase-like Zn-dependent dehydrogenase